MQTASIVPVPAVVSAPNEPDASSSDAAEPAGGPGFDEVLDAEIDARIPAEEPAETKTETSETSHAPLSAEPTVVLGAPVSAEVPVATPSEIQPENVRRSGDGARSTLAPLPADGAPPGTLPPDGAPHGTLPPRTTPPGTLPPETAPPLPTDVASPDQALAGTNGGSEAKVKATSVPASVQASLPPSGPDIRAALTGRPPGNTGEPPSTASSPSEETPEQASGRPIDASRETPKDSGTKGARSAEQKSSFGGEILSAATAEASDEGSSTFSSDAGEREHRRAGRPEKVERHPSSSALPASDVPDEAEKAASRTAASEEAPEPPPPEPAPEPAPTDGNTSAPDLTSEADPTLGVIENTLRDGVKALHATSRPLPRGPVSAAWLRAALHRNGGALSARDGWNMLEMKLDDGDGTMIIKARRDAERVAVTVGFSDPHLRALTAEHADRLQEALRRHYDASVDLSFTGDGSDASPGREHANARPRPTAILASGRSGGEASEAVRPRAQRYADRNVWVG
ncbi:hypothetical protein [Rhodocaloribacter sp.]